MTTVEHKECYYCKKVEPENDYIWNARTLNNNGWLDIWRCHNNCMKKEVAEILATDDWERGRKYSEIHLLTNPLAEGLFTAKCGCKVAMIQNEPRGKYSFLNMEHWCARHIIYRFVYRGNLFKVKGIIYYIDKYILSITRLPMHRHYGSLFLEAFNSGIIDDPYHEKEYNINQISRLKF